MAVYKRGRVWWYKFTWNGVPIRESTKQANKKVAGQIEAAHRVRLANGEAGIHDRIPVPTLQEFAERDFLPFIDRLKTSRLRIARAGRSSRSLVAPNLRGSRRPSSRQTCSPCLAAHPSWVEPLPSTKTVAATVWSY